MEESPLQREISFRWDKSARTAAAAAKFAARVIGASPEYISHGEIQTGLSLDGTTWSSDLEALYADDFAKLGDERDLLVARDAADKIVAIAILAWEHSSRRSFAVLEDMTVEMDYRSHGLGARMLEHVEEAVRGHRIDWLFLESGVRNERAHAFFERQGFSTLSQVFAKRLVGTGF
ncbi:MAG TPA: GNAT family N-acetyltransferase [Kiloniellales bacterium]|nr:GNAT family N-acetyltransferase [Kiloniellales bacterium]